MRLIPETTTARAIAVLLSGLVLFHVASIWIFQIGLDSEVGLTNEVRLAERLFTIKRALASLPPTDREQMAHSLSGGPIEVHWSKIALTIETNPGARMADGLRQRLLQLAPELDSGLIIGLDSEGDPHLVLVSIKLADQSWANFSIIRLAGAHASLARVVASTSLMALSVLLLSVVILRSVTRPLRQCAAAVKRLYLDAEPHPIAISGPREIRDLAAAFNELQDRVKRLIDQRTLTLAAISHDLKAPLTRAKLRVEDVENSELRQNIESDLTEMLVMIDSTLEFLRGDQSEEAFREIDLNAILQSICDDMVDLGHAISLTTPSKLFFRGRHLALKRALGNLIVNATQYGTRVRIAASLRSSEVMILIDDNGPGIPEDQREAVFAPFHRLEGSRNRAAGGTGLGLTIARSVIRSHGGDVTLSDAPSGGLRAIVRLPLLCPRLETKRNEREILMKRSSARVSPSAPASAEHSEQSSEER